MPEGNQINCCAFQLQQNYSEASNICNIHFRSFKAPQEKSGSSSDNTTSC